MNILLILLAIGITSVGVLLFKVLKAPKICYHNSLRLNVKTLEHECTNCNQTVKQLKG